MDVESSRIFKKRVDRASALYKMHLRNEKTMATTSHKQEKFVAGIGVEVMKQLKSQQKVSIYQPVSFGGRHTNLMAGRSNREIGRESSGKKCASSQRKCSHIFNRSRERIPVHGIFFTFPIFKNLSLIIYL